MQSFNSQEPWENHGGIITKPSARFKKTESVVATLMKQDINDGNYSVDSCNVCFGPFHCALLGKPQKLTQLSKIFSGKKEEEEKLAVAVPARRLNENGQRL